MNAFEKLSLRTNPFRLTPTSDDNELVWAGFPDIKEKIERRIKRSIQIPNTTLVLNWGEYGSGKTHAARYFSKKSVLQELAGDTNAQPYSIAIDFPKSKEPVKDIFTQVIDRVNINELRLKINETGLNVQDAINKSTDNLFIRDLLRVIFDERRDPLRPLVDENVVKSYLYGGSDAKKMHNEGVLRKMSSDSDYTEFLGALFSLMTFENKAYSCVIIWIDEFEDISILNNTNISNVNNFIRTLIDKTPNNLLLFLNLTQSTLMSVEDLGEYLQESVKSRIKERINMQMPNSEELKKYISDLLNHPAFRYGDVTNNEYAPFEKDVIDAIIKDLDGASLRRYNEAFSLLVENAAFDDKTCIDLNYYQENKSEVVGWKD